MSIQISKRDLTKIIKEELADSEELLAWMIKAEAKQKKKGKKWCSKGNPFHDEDGEFVDPDKEPGSSSISATGTDCKRGQARRPGASRVERFTKVKCGRNAKYVCKDGSAKWGNEKVEEDQVLTKAQDRREKEAKSKSLERKRNWLGDLQSLGRGIYEEGELVAPKVVDVRTAQQQLQSAYKEINRLRVVLSKKLKANFDMERCTRAISQIVDATKGDYPSKPGKK